MENEEVKKAGLKLVEDDKQEVVIEDICYRFEEMVDGMEASMTNISQIISQQKKLVDIISTATDDYDEEEKKPFDELCKSTETQVKNLETQMSTLAVKKSLIEEVIKRCKEDSEHSKTISILAKGLGLFD